jgi:hypothetical protein
VAEKEDEMARYCVSCGNEMRETRRSTCSKPCQTAAMARGLKDRDNAFRQLQEWPAGMHFEDVSRADVFRRFMANGSG